MKKTFFASSRFREFAINFTLLSIAGWCFYCGSNQPSNAPIHWTTRIGTTVIFDQWVTGLTPVEMTIWEGDYFTRTQKQILTNVRSMHWHKQYPKDQFGWVW